MKKIISVTVFSLLACFLLVPLALAQAEQLNLSLSRDFGYGGFDGDIQGLFSMSASGPKDLNRVVFYIDTTSIGQASQAPFRIQFNTDNYPLGRHTLSAAGYSSGGQEYRSNVITANFVPASQSMKVVLPILGIILGVVLISAIISIVTGRKVRNLAPGSPRQYPIGGAVCPRCRRPFAFHLISMHVMGSKFDRCPYCGKWSFLRGASQADLRAAEQAELEGAGGKVPETSDDDKLKKELDDSKYQGS